MTSENIVLSAGDKAPDFELFDAEGNKHSLSDYKGKKVIIFCYPAAMTPGCTKQACDFRDALDPLQQSGYTILGMSPDKPEKLQKFIAKEDLNYPLLSNPERDVLEAYGAFGNKKLYGKMVRGVIRSTFIIDAEGLIEHALYNVKASGHVGRVRTLLEV